MNVKNIGVIAILLASLMWAIEPIFAKLAYQINPDYIQTSAVRAITVTIFSLIFIIITKKEKELLIEKKKIIQFILYCNNWYNTS